MFSISSDLRNAQAQTGLAYQGGQLVDRAPIEKAAAAQQCTIVDPPVREVPMILRETENAIQLNHELVVELEERLRPILRPTPPSGTEQAKTQDPSTLLASELKTLKTGVNLSNARLCELLRRLEV